MNSDIPGWVSLKTLYDRAHKSGKPVIYYLYRVDEDKLIKMLMPPDGNVTRYDGTSEPGKPYHNYNNTKPLRFDNYFHAYAYSLRQRKRMERLLNEAHT